MAPAGFFAMLVGVSESSSSNVVLLPHLNKIMLDRLSDPSFAAVKIEAEELVAKTQGQKTFLSLQGLAPFLSGFRTT